MHVVDDDPDNNKFIACAVSFKADHFISGDKALRTIQDYMGIKIVNPREFITIYRGIKG